MLPNVCYAIQVGTEYASTFRYDGDILMKSLYIDNANCFEDTSFQMRQCFFNAGHLLWGSDSAVAQQNLDLLKNYSEVFQQAAFNLFS
jgi:hypothetical protein